jgi:hypothetical protein
VTLPGHAGIFSGAPSSVWRHAARLQPMASITTLAEVLAHGFATAGFSNNLWVSPATGLAQGFAHFDHRRRPRPTRLLQRLWHALVPVDQRVAVAALTLLPRVLD